MTTTRIRLLLLFEGASFFTAALMHFGVLVRGYEHQEAGTAESVIGGVLLAGLVLTFAIPARARAAFIAAQTFALLGTLVGALTIAIGVGPRSVPDLAYHLSILASLAWGLLLGVRRRRAAERGSASHYRPNPSGRNTRVFVGTYDFGLRRDASRWRIDRFRFNLKYVEGNLELEK